MNSSFMVLKSDENNKPIGYMRHFVDGDNFTLQITITSLKFVDGEVFAILFSSNAEEIARSKIDCNSSSIELAGKGDKFDLLLATNSKIVSFVSLAGAHSKEFYFSRFLSGESVYDDEAIATENYYLLEENCGDIKGFDNGNFSAKNELSFSGNQGEKEENKKANICQENQDGANKKSGVEPYYKRVQKRLMVYFCDTVDRKSVV